MDRTTAFVEHNDCRVVSEILGRVGERWSVLVVVALRERSQRFSALKRAVNGISQQMLTHTLKKIERDGLLSRTIRDTTPPQVSYELTDLRYYFSKALHVLAEWSIDNQIAIHEGRASYDDHKNG